MQRDSTAVEFLEAGTPWKCAPHVFVPYDETGFKFFIIYNLLNILSGSGVKIMEWRLLFQ